MTVDRGVPPAFATAEARARQAVEADARDPSVRPRAGTRLWSHRESRPRAVLMLHGYTHSPAQLSGLAQHFFDHGYNVFVPRAPLHGLTTPAAHSGIAGVGLRAYATDAWAVAAGLGAEAGVVGISAGAALGTWLTTQRTAPVRRLLALAPFFRPHRRMASPVAAVALRMLYGSRLVPDRINDRGYSYTALAQYLRISSSIRLASGGGVLARVAVAISAADEVVDRDTAISLPAAIAGAAGASFGHHLIPATAGLGHDIVSPSAIGTHADELHRRYLALYDASASTAS
ncbi:alpha/beta hydrolase [Micromonospora andamanensis]|uniref:AB hydrolase-1 domain-containing protein n=1 Tax=Micromonospora andamanensis TaxID=1287068 RepID=A0ABQ4I335_9ACTN|nr:alpha/beta fold hydrolase [Micromonospora andamanensis]GIJ12281.1 hypothetical protein Van01_54950 [Micromonospora andamanensis]